MSLTGVTDPGLDYSGARATTDKLSLDDVLAEVLLNDTDFLSRIEFGPDATQTTHYWVEDSERSHEVVLNDSGTNVAGSASEATFVVDSAPQLRVGMLLYNTAQAAAEPEIIQITSVNTASTSFEVERGYGGTTAVATHADNETWHIIGGPKLESADASSDVSKARTNGSNTTQIFERAVKISGSTLPLASAGVNSEYARQTFLRMVELRKELALATVSGYANANAAAGSATQTRSMKGLLQFINDANVSSLIKDASSNALDLDSHINPVVTSLWDLGAFNQGSPGLILVNSFNQRQISAFDSNKQRFTEDSRMAGRYVQSILSDIGMSLDVVVDRFVPKDKAIITDLGRIKLKYLTGRQMVLNEKASSGDYALSQLIGELTLEVRNAAQAHAMIHSTSTS